jgi:hypothetical protein
LVPNESSLAQIDAFGSCVFELRSVWGELERGFVETAWAVDPAQPAWFIIDIAARIT